MTVQKLSVAGATPASGERWNQVNWQLAQTQVHRLQMRIAKAVQQEKWGKVKALQWLLTHSHHAKLLAVKRVSSNAGAKTSGIDKVRWQTPKQKYEAVKSLRRRGYKAQALRRIYIPKKKNGPPYFYDSETMHLVVNYYIDSMGIEDIAMLLGLSPDSVNQILDHILPHLS